MRGPFGSFLSYQPVNNDWFYDFSSVTSVYLDKMLDNFFGGWMQL